ncbi:hypothetical protein [Sphingomonas jaspsi]|uniref:hypothetical protein n=1 Tax=Sphingomonas jaspsi TaxID=392409 RepID=UPI0012EC254E|nr:hypothetical protein [Sphingomonas jaspsi]
MMVRNMLLPLAGCLSIMGCSSSEPAPQVQANNATEVEAANVVDNEVNQLAPPASDEGIDAKVAGTDFNAVADIPCGIDGKLDDNCSAGVKRDRAAGGTSFVEVTKPDKSKRVLFFQGTAASGADSSQADGSASYRFLWHREGDWTVIKYGPERYRVPDALVVGS